jgi:hypothetical protein
MAISRPLVGDLHAEREARSLCLLNGLIGSGGGFLELYSKYFLARAKNVD